MNCGVGARQWCLARTCGRMVWPTATRLERDYSKWPHRYDAACCHLLSVCLCVRSSVEHNRESYRNGWTDRGAVCGMDFGMSWQLCMRCGGGVGSPTRRGTFGWHTWACQTCRWSTYSTNTTSFARRQQRCGLSLPLLQQRVTIITIPTVPSVL